MEEKIVERILRELNFKEISEGVVPKLISSEKFYERLERELISNGYSSPLSFLQKEVIDRIVADIAAKFVQKHGQEILASLDPQAISHAVMIKAIAGCRDSAGLK